MNVTIIFEADDLAEINVTGGRWSSGEWQVSLDRRLRTVAYVTADDAGRIAQAWECVRAELADREAEAAAAEARRVELEGIAERAFGPLPGTVEA